MRYGLIGLFSLLAVFMPFAAADIYHPPECIKTSINYDLPVVPDVDIEAHNTWITLQNHSSDTLVVFAPVDEQFIQTELPVDPVDLPARYYPIGTLNDQKLVLFNDSTGYREIQHKPALFNIDIFDYDEIKPEELSFTTQLDELRTTYDHTHCPVQPLLPDPTITTFLLFKDNQTYPLTATITFERDSSFEKELARYNQYLEDRKISQGKTRFFVGLYITIMVSIPVIVFGAIVWVIIKLVRK